MTIMNWRILWALFMKIIRILKIALLHAWLTGLNGRSVLMVFIVLKIKKNKKL